MVILNNKKFFFFLKLKFNFLNNNYLCFFKYYNYQLKDLCNKYGLNILKIQSNYCKKIFNLDKGFFMNLNQSLIYFNDFNKFSKILENLNINTVFLFSSSGFFLNSLFINKLNYYYMFYNNNFKLFIFIVYININRFKFIIFMIIFKFIYILNIIYLKKNSNKN